MRFKIKLDMDGAAFDTDWRSEVQRILRDIAETIEDGDDYLGTNVFDSNGNTVGRFTLID